jgi:HME family heavy-metal exporter
VKGLADLQVEKQNRIPQLRVEADYDRAKLYGVTPAALTGALEGMSSGRIVSQVVTEGNRRFDVVIRLSDTDRSTTGLADLLIETPSGHVPLQLVAKIQETDGPNQILRENGQRRIAVYANSDGKRDRAEIVADIRGVLAQTQWPQGYGATLEGTYQAYEEAAARIGAWCCRAVIAPLCWP